MKLPFLFFLALASLATAADRPNIILIMSDDMGFSDIGCYGSEIDTPNLDGLAGNGLRFTQFYNTARCCPTRASLLTGVYPHQAGIGHMMNDRGHDGYRGDLNRSTVTIAEVLGASGYRTYLSGKWHVTKHTSSQSDADKSNWPLQRGFDRFYGTIHGAGSFFDPNTLTRGNEYISPFADPEYQPDGQYYYTNAISDHAVRFIEEHGSDHEDDPFFMYVSYTAAHWPMHALPEDHEKYKGRYDEGYDAIRNARYEKMLELGLVDRENTVNLPIPEEWKAPAEHLDWDINNMEVYGAMVDSMDQGIGQIVDALEANGELENTLILFFQDNGGCAENYGRRGEGRPRAAEPELSPLAADYLQPDMEPRQNRDGFIMRTGPGAMAGPDDTYIGYGRGWATVSNTPFREDKHWVHEGGISSPLIAHWPAGFERKNELEFTPGHLVDLMATCVDISGADYPETFHEGNAITPMEGLSLAPVFRGEDLEREAIYWEHEGNRAIRVGDLKLVAKGANGPWELYDISKDRSEHNDLAETLPEKVEELAAMWQAWAERAMVLPLNPQNDRANSAHYNRKQSRFELSQGDNLSTQEGPWIKDRGIQIVANVRADIAEPDGVIVAQGGDTHGWALYLDQTEVVFGVTRNGTLSEVRGGSAADATEITVRMEKDASVQLMVDGKEVASETLPGVVVSQPQDGLQVGQDLNGSVGSYDSPARFGGRVDSVVLELIK